MALSLWFLISLYGWEAFPTPGAFTHTRITLALSQWCHKPRVSLQGPLYTHDFAGTPHREVRDSDSAFYAQDVEVLKKPLR